MFQKAYLLLQDIVWMIYNFQHQFYLSIEHIRRADIVSEPEVSTMKMLASFSIGIISLLDGRSL